MKRTLFFTILLFVFGIPISWGAIPETISYQGVLTDASGVAVPDGNYNLTFKLYGDQNAVTPLWTETQMVPVKNGIFNVILGTVEPLNNHAFDKQYWLEVATVAFVNGNPPPQPPSRTPLTASPYSLNTRSGGSAGDGHSLDAADGDPTDAVFVDNDGNVGIGTTSPGTLHPAKLDVHGNIILSQDAATHTLINAFNNFPGWSSNIQAFNDQVVRIFMGVAGSSWPSGYPVFGMDPRSNLAYVIAHGDADTMAAGLVLGTGDVSPLILGTNSNEQMRITPDGNVGIGTETPSVKLHVIGRIHASDTSGSGGVTLLGAGTSNGAFTLNYHYDADGNIPAGTYAWGTGGSTVSNFVFSRWGEPVMFIGLGDEYTYNIGIGTTAPTEKLHVVGNVLANQYLTPSSRRWKTDIQSISDSLSKIQRLRGVTYDWKADGKRDIGLIAEEVGEVIPEIVAYEENGVDARSVDYARLVALLIEGVKEQQQKIDEQQREIEAQRERIAALEQSQAELKDLKAKVAQFEAVMKKLEGLTAVQGKAGAKTEE